MEREQHMMLGKTAGSSSPREIAGPVTFGDLQRQAKEEVEQEAKQHTYEAAYQRLLDELGEHGFSD
jgi:hypothetical protein